MMARVHPGKSATTTAASRNRAASRAGFTLVEMVIVVAIVVILVSLVAPAASTLWANRKLADVQNTIRGLLMTTRAKAMETVAVDRGLFFFIDEHNVQRIVPIVQDPDQMDDLAWQNIFKVTTDQTHALPAPIRVVPRYIVEDPDNPNLEEWQTFEDQELEYDGYSDPPTDGNKAQLHRNYFTIVFSTDGQLVRDQDVLIYDEDADEDEIGDRTGLRVSPDIKTSSTRDYYGRDDTPLPIDPTGSARVFENLVIDYEEPEQPAVNFPPVDGLLVYDDSLFSGLSTAAQKREYLLKKGQPMYINRLTGGVIRGPTGENLE